MQWVPLGARGTVPATPIWEDTAFNSSSLTTGNSQASNVEEINMRPLHFHSDAIGRLQNVERSAATVQLFSTIVVWMFLDDSSMHPECSYLRKDTQHVFSECGIERNRSYCLHLLHHLHHKLSQMITNDWGRPARCCKLLQAFVVKHTSLEYFYLTTVQNGIAQQAFAITAKTSCIPATLHSR